MPDSLTTNSKSKKPKPAAKPSPAQLEILLSGPFLLVPEVLDGKIGSIDIYSPNNGHPVGAVFQPGVFLTDDDLEHPDFPTFPDLDSFSLLDPHSYVLELTQEGRQKPLPATSIPETNHKVRPGRKLGSNWEIVITLRGILSGWSSHRTFDATDGRYHGSDAPAGRASNTHRLRYAAVTAAEFSGARKEAKDYLAANIGQGGTLAIAGEVPYQASLLHERNAIDALARLAGLDLQLTSTTVATVRTRLTGHLMPCVHSIVVV